MQKKKYIEKKKLEEEIRKLNRDSESIIVEGYNDKRILRKLGYQGKIFLCAEKSIEHLEDELTRQVENTTILTDFDSHGKELNKQIFQALDENIDVLKSSRKDFGKQLTSTGRRDIEDIEPLLSSIEDKFVDAALDSLYFNSR